MCIYTYMYMVISALYNFYRAKSHKIRLVLQSQD